MMIIDHEVKHHYQPTNNSCGYTALAILLSYYGVETTPEKIMKVVPQPRGEDGALFGSVTAQLVAWCSKQGLQTHMYSFDFQTLDLSWSKMDEQQIAKRLVEIGKVRVVPSLGKYWTELYIDAYIDMLKAGSKLTIAPHVTTKLIYRLLQAGPVYANICSTVSGGRGRSRHVDGVRKTVLDDINGKTSNHSLVIYGNDAKGNFLVADPWDGLTIVDPETMVCSITAAQIECDNQLFTIEK